MVYRSRSGNFKERSRFKRVTYNPIIPMMLIARHSEKCRRNYQCLFQVVRDHAVQIVHHALPVPSFFPMTTLFLLSSFLESDSTFRFHFPIPLSDSTFFRNSAQCHRVGLRVSHLDTHPAIPSCNCWPVSGLAIPVPGTLAEALCSASTPSRTPSSWQCGTIAE